MGHIISKYIKNALTISKMFLKYLNETKIFWQIFPWWVHVLEAVSHQKDKCRAFSIANKKLPPSCPISPSGIADEYPDLTQRKIRQLIFAHTFILK